MTDPVPHVPAAAPRRPPMVTVVGRKHSGKTTLAVRLVAALVARGHRVMTIKHGHHTFNLDPSTTDTYRHYHEGGAERVAMAAPDKFALVMRWGEDPRGGGPELSPEVIAERHLSDADVVVCEGFKASALPMIEVFREAAHRAPLYEAGGERAGQYLAVVTDVPADPRLAGARVLSFEDPGHLDALVAVVEKHVMGRDAAD